MLAAFLCDRQKALQQSGPRPKIPPVKCRPHRKIKVMRAYYDTVIHLCQYNEDSIADQRRIALRGLQDIILDGVFLVYLLQSFLSSCGRSPSG